MANEINWDDYGTPIATEEPPADTGYGDLNFLNSLVGGRLSQAITPEPIPDRFNSPINWDQYGTPIDEQQTQDQPNEGTAQQPEAQPQVEDAPRQQAKLDRIAQTRARLEAQDAARARVTTPARFDQAASAVSQGMSSQPDDPNHLDWSDEALLGAAQGVANVGRQVGGAVRSLGPQSAVGGLLTFFGGAQKVGKAISDYSTEQAKQFQEEGQADPTAKTGKMINWLASSATGLAPIVVSGEVGGLPLVAATMGAQSFGGTYENAIERYQQDGLSEEEAARKAYLPAVISGAVSAAIGHAVGPTGLGALANKALAGTTIRQIVGSILKDAGLGGAQGFTDTLAQGIIQKATYDPARSWSEIVPDALESGAGGALVGGLASGAHQALGAFSRAAQGEPPVISVVSKTETTQPNESERSYLEKKRLRLETEASRRARGFIASPPAGKVQWSLDQMQGPQQPREVNPATVTGFSIPDWAKDTAGVPVPEAKPVTLPKINVPEKIAAQVDQHLASDPSALTELHNLVNAEISEKPLVQVFDNLPSVVDHVVKNPAQASPEQLQAAQSALTDALAKVQAIDLPKAQLKTASDPLLQILNDLKAHEQGQEDVLYHGTNRAFDKFGETALGNAGKVRGQAVGRYYFSEDPESAARVGEAGGYKLVSVDEWAANHDFEHNDPEALTTLRTALQEAIDKGKRVAYMQDDGDYVWAKKSDDLKTYEELDSARVYNPSRMPRLLKATIGGRTLDLRKPYEQWPDTLRKVVPKPGNLSFYWHDSAPALYQWAKDNGYSKINVIDSYESGGKSVIVLPHAIGKFEEIESAGFPKERRHEQSPLEFQSQAQPVAQSEAGRSAEQVPPEPNVNPGASAASGIASAWREPVQPIAQRDAQRSAQAVERSPDIIDQIFDNYGTIQAKKTARKGTEGYYGDVYAMVREQRPRLFSKNGITPDRVVDNLRRDGLVGEDFSVDDLWDEIHKANRARSAHFKGELPEQKEGKFHQLLIDANKAKKHYVVSVGDLEIGTRFKIKGESFTVENIDPDDGSVQVKDGPKFGYQVIPDGADIPVQKGTLKKPNKPLTVDQAWPTEPEKTPNTVPTLRSGENQGDLLAKQQEDFALVGQKGADYEAIQKAKAKAEADRAEAAKGQSDMFGQLAKGWTEASGETDQGPKESKYQLRFDPNEVVRGHDALRALVNAPDSGVTGIALKAFNALLDNPNLRDLFGSIGVAIHDGGTGFAGLADITNGILHLSKSFATVETASHEVFHFVYDRLPDFMKQQVEASRLAALDKHFGGNIPPEFRNGMSSVEWKSKGLSSDTYSLINASEHLATFAGETLGKEAGATKPTTFSGKIAATVRGWIQAIADTLSRLTGQKYDLCRVVRDVLSGKIKMDADTAGEGEHASYVHNAAEAEAAAKLARDHEERSIEGKNLLGQSFDLLKALGRAGAETASDKVRRLLGLQDVKDIARTGESLHGIAEGYRNLIEKTPEPDAKLRIARVAAVKWEAFDRDQLDLTKQRDDLQGEVSSPSFLRKIDKTMLAKASVDSKEAAETTFKAEIRTALNKAQNLQKEGNLNERDRNIVLGQIKELTEASKSSSALSGLVQDMTRVLASTPEGLALLESGGPRADFRKVYSDLKRSVDEPLHAGPLMNLAAYLLEKAPKLRTKLLANDLASDSEVRKSMTEFENKFIPAYGKDPVKAVMAELRKATGMGSNLAKAKFAWRIIHEPLIKQVQKLIDLNQAVEIGAKVNLDPEVVGLRKELRQTVGAIGDSAHPLPQTFTDSTIVTPSGRQIDLSMKGMVGDKEAFNALRTEGVAAAKEIQSWLSENEPGTANYDYHVRNLKTLEDTINGTGALRPNDPLKIKNRTFGILQNVAQVVGGRSAAVFKTYVAKFDRISHAAALWTDKWTHQLVADKLPALRSHDLKWGGLRKMTIEQANDLWWKQVGNELAYSGNRQSGPLEVGDSIGTLGWKVTREDVQYARNQRQSASEGFTAAGPDQHTTDTLGGPGAEFQRKALSTGPYGAPITPETDLLGFGQDMAKSSQAYREATNDAEKAQALGQLEDTFANNFTRVGKSFTEDREFEIVKKNVTPLDGPEGAFASVWPQIEDGTIQSAPEYFQALAEASGHNVDEVKSIVLPEFGRMLEAWAARYTPDQAKLQRLKADESKNAFTLARGDRVAPYAMYRFGFKDAGEVRKFGATIYSRSFDAVRNGLNALTDDLTRVKTERDAKIQQEYDSGNYDAKQDVMKRRRIERQQDRNMDDYYNLETKIDRVKAMQEHFNKRTPTTARGLLQRGWDDIVGSALGLGAMVGDVVQTPFQVGRTLSLLHGSWIKGYGIATGAYLDAVARLIASAALSGTKGIYNLALADPSSPGGRLGGGVIGALAHVKEDRSISKFIDRAVSPALQELTGAAHTRLWSQLKFQKYGIEPARTVAQDISNSILGSISKSGTISGDPKEMQNFAQKLAHGGLGTFEVLGKMLWNNWYRANDTVVNQAIHDAMLVSKWGPMDMWDKASRDFHVRVKEGNRPYDFADLGNHVNEPSAQEILGTWTRTGLGEAFRSVNKMDILNLHTRAGIDFAKNWHDHQVAMNEGRGDTPLYTMEQKYALAHQFMNKENKQTKVNESQVLKDSSLIAKIMKPYQSWQTRQLSNFVDMFAVPLNASAGYTGKQDALMRVAAFAGAAAPLLGLLVAGALVKTQGDMVRRPFQKAFFNQVTASKLPWERQGTGKQALGWMLAAANSIPYVGIVANAMFDDMPSRAAYDPAVAMIERGKMIGQYVGGAIQTGDVTYRLPETIGSILPDSKLILNRLDSESGKRENINAANLIRRYADPETIKAIGKGSFEATPLTPYAAKMANAALNGDDAELTRLRDEAVQVATALGKEKPEQSVESAFRNQLAYNKALKQKMTPEQMDRFKAQLSDADLEVITKAENAFTNAATVLGTREPSFIKLPAQGPSGVRASRVNVGPSRLGSSRTPKIRGLSQIKRTRVARAPRARRSLARSGRRLRTFA